ncbi:MAG: addiction module antitoxin RelB [Deltaproteobacteria bacterium]|nr:MAG: addiction module antitoxin RelB [Deltaproteobacteria bacterium]RLC15834.1 MAG: addiction module antitoxin RelB [Deltaproteobacteria bacterium]
MKISLPLEKMTRLDKIAVMEKIWDDLCRDPELIPSPSWHEDVLKAREMEIDERKATFESFDLAKKRIRDQVK